MYGVGSAPITSHNFGSFYRLRRTGTHRYIWGMIRHCITLSTVLKSTVMSGVWSDNALPYPKSWNLPLYWGVIRHCITPSKVVESTVVYGVWSDTALPYPKSRNQPLHQGYDQTMHYPIQSPGINRYIKGMIRHCITLSKVLESTVISGVIRHCMSKHCAMPESTVASTL